jgi:hypothetical protein
MSHILLIRIPLRFKEFAKVCWEYVTYIQNITVLLFIDTL